MNKQRKQSISNLNEDSRNITVLLFIFVAFFLTMSLLSPKTFLSIATMRSMCVQLPEFGIYSLAMMFAMISGGIDLSIVSIGNLASILACSYMINQMQKTDTGNEAVIIITGIVIALIVGVVCGIFNGFAISVIGIPPMLATLATMQIFDGISMIFTEGASVQGLPEGFALIGSKTVFNAIPVIMILFLFLVFVIHIIQNHTYLGFTVYMLGTNKTASDYSGINTVKTTIICYAFSGFLSTIAGLILSSRSMSARMDYGSIYQLQAILAVVLGGISPLGGKGKVVGVMLAVLALQVLSTGLNILSISATSYLKNLVWGLLLIVVLVAKYYMGNHRDTSK